MKIGLVLSGGMVRGALQVGALKAIREYLAPTEVEIPSCASIGALNGYAFATDKLDTLESLWLNVCDDNSRLFIRNIAALLDKDRPEKYRITSEVVVRNLNKITQLIATRKVIV